MVFWLISVLLLVAIIGGIVFLWKRHQRTQAEQEAQSAIVAAELLASARKANQADAELPEAAAIDLAAPDLLDIPTPQAHHQHQQHKSSKKHKKGKHTPQAKAAPKIVTPAMVPKITPATPDEKKPTNTSETILVLAELKIRP